MTNKYTEHLQERAEYNHAQAVYWTAQALESLSQGYYKTAFNGLQNAAGHIYDLDTHTARIPDHPDLDSPEFMQAHQQAIKTATERARTERKDSTDDLDPERIETVADLRARIKAGDPTARDLITDLASDCPTQATAWIQREDLDRWTAEQLNNKGYTPMDTLKPIGHTYKLTINSDRFASAIFYLCERLDENANKWEYFVKLSGDYRVWDSVCSGQMYKDKAKALGAIKNLLKNALKKCGRLETLDTYKFND